MARRRRLLQFIGISVALHAALLLARLLPSPARPEEASIPDVELVGGAGTEEGAPSGQGPGAATAGVDAPAKASRARARPRAAGRRGARASAGRRGVERPAGGGEPAAPRGSGDPCLLSMRDCQPAGQADGTGSETGAATQGGAAASPARKDRLASFRSRGEAVPDADRPVVQTRLREQGLEIATYEDGGRLLRAGGASGLGGLGNGPGRGAAGLLSLASARVGEGAGRNTCDPYKGYRARGQRELVLLVDTSGSMKAGGRVPAAIVCAAGAALAGLAQGNPVSVVNFSTETYFSRATRSTELLYDAISRVQGQDTVLPKLSTLPLGPGRARDYVLISDAGIHNLEQVLPDYRRVLAAEPESRALLFLLAHGAEQEVVALEKAGFRRPARQRTQ
jgi:hypothetical protein